MEVRDLQRVQNHRKKLQHCLESAATGMGMGEEELDKLRIEWIRDLGDKHTFPDDLVWSVKIPHFVMFGQVLVEVDQSLPLLDAVLRKVRARSHIDSRRSEG